jgi:hypothetical protein
MKNLLSEEIERYQKLSFYNPKLTSTENNNNIFEAILNPATAAREVEIAAGAGKNLQSLIKKFKIANMTVEEVGILLAKSPKEFEKSFQKALSQDVAAGITGTLGPASKNLSKIDLLRRMASDSKSYGGRALTKKEIDKLILDISSTNKIKAAQFKPKVKPNPKDIEDGGGAVRVDPSLKKLDWKSLVKKGAIISLSLGALYYIYKLTHEDEPPIIVPPVPVPVPPVPNPKQYRSCPDTFPIAPFCKNETIRKVQGCLGRLTTDGLFGPKTQEALKSKGVDSTSITQQTVDKVCNNAPLVDPDTEDVDGQDPNNM